MKRLYFLLITVFLLNNAHAQWTKQESGTTNYLYSVFFVDQNLGFAVGEGGTILKTVDGGTNWKRQNSGSTTNVFFTVFFVDSQTGYITNVDNTILKTTDGGTTWVEKSPGIEYHIMSIFFINADIGWIVSGCGEIFKTTNGGDSWVKQLNCGYFVRSCYFVDENIGYAVGEFGKIIKTSDGGATWILQAGNSAHLMSIYFLNAETGYAVGEMGRILKTTNGGITWEESWGNSDGIGLNSVAFTDVNTGIAVGYNGKIIKTTNGGNSWNSQSSGTNESILSIYTVDANISYAVGMNGIILKTTCGGGITTTVNSETICNGASTTLTASGANKYMWSTGDTTKSITVKPHITASYKVTGSTLGCTDDAISTVEVYNFNVSAQSQTITCGSSLILKSNSNYIGTGQIKYTWLPSYGLSDTTIASPAANPKQNTTYTLITSTSDGCSSSSEVNVSVVPFEISISDRDIVCGENAILSTTTNYTGTGNISYSWQPGYRLNDSVVATPISNTNKTITYSISATSSDGCKASKNVNVNVLPLTISGSSTNISCGNSAQLHTYTNYTGPGSLKYVWEPADNLDSPNIENPVAKPMRNITYNVTATTSNGCVTKYDFPVLVDKINITPEICSVSLDSTNKNVVMWNKPLSSAVDSFYIYRETEVTNVYTKIGAVPYENHSIFVDKNSNPSIQSNKYKISIYDNCNYETALSLPHKTMHLSINQGTGNTWNLIWERYEGIEVSTYRIYRGLDPKNLTLIGTSPASNTQYSDFTAPAGYVYYQIEIISATECNPYKSAISIRSNIATNNPLSVENVSVPDFKIYPNPATDHLIVETNDYASERTIQILNLNGQELVKQKVHTKKIQIDISDLPVGIYFVKLTDDKATKVRKIIKK
jgi:photosystem II stability/assembly factor-like uncharacterized protein